MGLFDRFKKKKNTGEAVQPAQQAGEAVPSPSDGNAADMAQPTQKKLFQTAMTEENTAKRNEAIRAITDQGLLYELVRNGTYETDRVLALDRLTDQDLLFKAATGAEIPKIRSLAEKKLDDGNHYKLIYYPGTSRASQLYAANWIDDADLLVRLMGDGKLPLDVRLSAAGKLERCAPERAAREAELIAGLREEEAQARPAAGRKVKDAKQAQTGKRRFTEKDNLGTRQETMSQATAYWMFERPRLSVKPPFTLFTMPSAQEAERALLELPYIHRAGDSGKLICERLMTFGFYEVTENGAGTGRYEAILSGSDLTAEEFRRAEAAFTRHGGSCRNHEAPSALAKKPAGAGNASLVRYSRTEKGNDGISTYEVYTGPDKAGAIAFLKEKQVNRRQYYIVVETPEGSFGRDINGFYQE